MRRFVLRLVVAVLVLVAAVGGWLWVAAGSGEPSGPLPGPVPDVASPGSMVFVIDQSRSLASFEIQEELRGAPNIVVGETDQISGRVIFDPADLTTATLSDIVVNARTFRTDSARRDRAMRGPVILDSASDEHEFITFVPVSVDSLEGGAILGETYEFTVAGDLTIKGTTRPVTFDVVAQLSDETTLEGSATARVRRSDFGIGIPTVPGVANVVDELILYFDFVAVSG
ncbi:MAG: YceI family protein [Acidimicrobiia bacterium]